MQDFLLLEIARCPEIELCLKQGKTNHPCSAIVQSQNSHTRAEQQTPEPWSGQITQAPLLFLSSNPSISTEDAFPRQSWRDEEISDFFNNRFGVGQNGQRQPWIQGGVRALAHDGSYLRVTKFWAAVRQRAIELYEREVEPGVDYALTEIVHCKSKSETGVAEAQTFCAQRYLRRVLNLAGARVIVVLGKAARQVMVQEFGMQADATVWGPDLLCGKERCVTFLPHPNAHAERSFAKCLPTHEVERLRRVLRY